MEGEDCGSILVSDKDWIDVEFEVAYDGGSTVNVCHPGGSRAGQNFIVGNGAKVPSDGQANLHLQAGGGLPDDIIPMLQPVNVSMPLMSVGGRFDAGMEANFKKERANVVSPDGATVSTFERQPGGLCAARLKRKRPAPPFGRAGAATGCQP